MPPSKFLASISHAVSGSAGSALSTLATYPLDLVNTRLKVQRQLRADYTGVADAFARIYAHEGGIPGFFVGLAPDVAKSVADAFLFFLFYNWFRARRLAAKRGSAALMVDGVARRYYLNALEELAVGAAAGACARLFTTPVANVVTRTQTASLVGGGTHDHNHEAEVRKGANGHSNGVAAEKDESAEGRRAKSSRNQGDLSFWEMVAEIRREKGFLGLWAGYSASLVLTLNPSITFFLQQFLRKSLVPNVDLDLDSDETAAKTTFLLAAVSKVVATSVTYPFQMAKARVQVSAPAHNDKGLEGRPELNGDVSKPKGPSQAVSKVLSDTIFAVVYRIAKTEGLRALYNGIGGELLKAFFNHGLTMLAKDVVHRFLVKMYLAVVAAIRRNPEAWSNLLQTARTVRRQVQQASLVHAIKR